MNAQLRFATTALLVPMLALPSLNGCTRSVTGRDAENTATDFLAETTSSFDVRDKCLTAPDRAACLNEAIYKAPPNAALFGADGAREQLSFDAQRTLATLFPEGLKVEVDETQIARDEFLARVGRMSIESLKLASGGILSQQTVAALFGDSAKAFIDSLDSTHFSDVPYQELRMKVEKLMGDVLVRFSDDLIDNKAEVKKYVFDNMQLIARRNWGRMDQALQDKFVFTSFAIMNERVAWLEGHMDQIKEWRAHEDRDPKVSLAELQSFAASLDPVLDKVQSELVQRAQTDADLKAKLEALELTSTKQTLDALETTTSAISRLPASPDAAPTSALDGLRAATRQALESLEANQNNVAGAVAVLALFNGEAARRLDVAYKATTSVVKGIDQIAAAGASFAMLGGVGAVIAGVQMVQSLTQKDASQVMAQQLMRAVAELSKQIQRLDDLVRAKFLEVNGKLDTLNDKLDALDARLIDEMRVLRATLEEVRAMVARLDVAQRQRHEDQMKLLRDILLASYEGTRVDVLDHFNVTLEPFSPAAYTAQLTRLNEAMKVTFAKDAFTGSSDLFDRAAIDPNVLPSEPRRLRGRGVEHAPNDFVTGGALALARRNRGTGPLDPPARVVNPFLWSDASQVLAYLVASHNVFRDPTSPNAWRADRESRPLLEGFLDLGIEDLKLAAHLQTNAALFTSLLDAAAAAEEGVRDTWLTQFRAALMAPYFATDAQGRFTDVRVPSDVRERHERRLSPLWPAQPGGSTRAAMLDEYLQTYLKPRTAQAFQDGAASPLESRRAFPDSAADPDHLFGDVELPVLTWPGQELIGSEDDERARYGSLNNPHRAARGAIPTSFLNAEVFGVGGIHKHYVVHALRGDTKQRGYRGFSVEMLADFVPYTSHATIPLARLVYDYECVSPSPEPLGANQVGLLAKIDPQGIRLDYEAFGRRFVCTMQPTLRAKESRATAEDTAWVESTFRSDVVAPAVAAASGAFFQPSSPASRVLTRHQAASRSLASMLQLAFPTSFVDGGVLALPVLTHDERPLLSDLAKQIADATAASFAPSLAGLGSESIDATYRTVTNAAIPGLAKANVYRDAVLGRIASTSTAVSAVLANLPAGAGASDRLRERMLVERLLAAGVELDPRVLQMVRFYWTYLGIVPATDPDARKCDGVVATGEQSVVRIEHGSMLARCGDDLKLAPITLYCDGGYQASGSSCVEVTCSGHAVGSSWTSAIDGGTVTSTCRIDGTTQATTACEPTHDLTGSTCTAKSCGIHPHGTSWTETIPAGTRRWTCTYGASSIAGTSCAEGHVMQNNNCDQLVGCGGNHFFTDRWIEQKQVAHCVVSIGMAECLADGTVKRTTCGNHVICGPDAETDPPECFGL